MRLLLVSSMVFSLTSLASTTIRLESEDYTLEATLTPSNTNSPSGQIHAPYAVSGDCYGTYYIDWEAELLTITFETAEVGEPGDIGVPGEIGEPVEIIIPDEDADGEYAEGGCANESMEVNLSTDDYKRLEKGEEVEVSFMSQLFDYAPREGRARVVARTDI